MFVPCTAYISSTLTASESTIQSEKSKNMFLITPSVPVVTVRIAILLKNRQENGKDWSSTAEGPAEDLRCENWMGRQKGLLYVRRINSFSATKV